MSVSTAAERAAPPRWPDGYFTVKDGTRLHYVEAGQGVPVILIHGARGSAIGNWFSNGIAPRLAQTNHVYALDMRAHGLSGGARHSHFNMADDVLEFMDQMGIGKAHIAGYSMPELAPTNPANDYGAYKGSANNHGFIIENVVDTLKGRTTLTTNALEGLKVVEIIERIYEKRDEQPV